MFAFVIEERVFIIEAYIRRKTAVYDKYPIIVDELQNDIQQTINSIQNVLTNVHKRIGLPLWSRR